eukprot:3365704-Pleurochrysis_carterae.AAC.2
MELINDRCGDWRQPTAIKGAKVQYGKLALNERLRPDRANQARAMLKTVGLPSPGGGPGTLGPAQRRTLKGTSLRASSPSRIQAATKPQPAAYDSNVQEEKIRNLQQQVFFLEQKLRALQDYHSSAERAQATKPRDLQAIRDERVRELETRHEELREEALRATFREKTTHAEKVKAVEQLSLARDQFATQRQELTAEVVNLQRELEHSYLREKTVHAELQQLLQQYDSLKSFNEGADTKARIWNCSIIL